MVRPLTLVAAAAVGWGAAAHQRSPAPPRRHVIEISAMQFSPSVLEMHRGDTITWINRDLVPHTATAGGTKPAFDTGAIAGGDSAIIVIGAVGGEYLCRLHPVMTGKLVVVP
jgi:plastocyanin